jgi:pyoverdine/dityrosine biosynthesis protein Dit1
VDYRVFADRFAIRRTNEKFWAYSDELHEAYKNMNQVEYGVLDYNRFENQ